MSDGLDVVVIGGGIAGTSTAAFLAGGGLRVRLYERATIAAGASGRNSGIVQHPFDPMLVDLYRRSLDAYADLGDALDGEFRLPAEPAGLLFVGRDAEAASAEVARWSATWPATRPELVAGPALHVLEPSLAADLIVCRLRIGYAVAPAAATEAFATLAKRSGVEVLVGDAATPVVDRGRVVGVRAAAGFVAAETVVVAAGPWTPAVIDPSGEWTPIAPIWGVVASVALESPPRHGLEAIDISVEPGASTEARLRDATQPASTTARDDLVEFSLAPSSGSSALGSTFLPAEPDRDDWLGPLQRVGARYVPAIATSPILGLRQCARPVSRDGRPLVGAVPWTDGLWVIAGHGPWGISTGPGSARLLADAILGNSAPLPEAIAVGRFGAPSG